MSKGARLRCQKKKKKKAWGVFDGPDHEARGTYALPVFFSAPAPSCDDAEYPNTTHRSNNAREIMASGMLVLVVTLVSLSQLQLKVDAFAYAGARGTYRGGALTIM